MSRAMLKAALKRGALVAAANWPVAFVQASADSLFKLLLAVPIIGGVFLVALAVGTEPAALISLDTRELLATVANTLRSRPLVLALFLLALAVVGVGGSMFVFLVKGGTVATLVESEREAGPIEEPPLHVATVLLASRFSVERFLASSRGLFPRYARLGMALIGVYLVSSLVFLAVVTTRGASEGWSVTAVATAGFVAWITIVNLVYLLIQIVIAAEDCSVAAAVRQVSAFLRRELRGIAMIFVLILTLVVAATSASIIATAALGLVAFVPFFGLAALPLQLLAWLLRGLVFQYLGLSSIGAYLRLYRGFAGTPELGRSRSGSPAQAHA